MIIKSVLINKYLLCKINATPLVFFQCPFFDDLFYVILYITVRYSREILLMFNFQRGQTPWKTLIYLNAIRSFHTYSCSEKKSQHFDPEPSEDNDSNEKLTKVSSKTGK